MKVCTLKVAIHCTLLRHELSHRYVGSFYIGRVGYSLLGKVVLYKYKVELFIVYIVLYSLTVRHLLYPTLYTGE